jgi:DNA-binding transcriptional LysR family regulator
MDDLDVRQLRYFVAVAEELSFSRAAERLNMAQPPLSRAIRQIERRLGADLFQRDTRHVVLTDAGRALLDDARPALDVVAGVSRRARRAALTAPALLVTAKPGIASGMLQRIVTAYSGLDDAPQVQIVVSGFRGQADMVRDGRADAALLSTWFDERGIDVEPLTSGPRVAALPADHPLARRDVLRCRDLRDEPVPLWPGTTPEEHAYWSGADADPGPDLPGAPRVTRPSGPVVTDPGQLLEVVALGQAAALIPEMLALSNPRSDIAYRPVADATPYTIVIAWPEGSRSSRVAQFVRTAASLYPNGADHRPEAAV